eukprot:scaffold34640_cov62-Isochrysis_galbana.AAC.1
MVLQNPQVAGQLPRVQGVHGGGCGSEAPAHTLADTPQPSHHAIAHGALCPPQPAPGRALSRPRTAGLCHRCATRCTC